jgi:DNA-binding transcriptional regulator YhcF (GntR family)
MATTKRRPEPLSQRESQILRCYAEKIRQTGLSPTLREVAAEVGCSHVAVYNAVKGLRRRKLMKGKAGKPRTITIDAEAAAPDLFALHVRDAIATGQAGEALLSAFAEWSAVGNQQR